MRFFIHVVVVGVVDVSLRSCFTRFMFGFGSGLLVGWNM